MRGEIPNQIENAAEKKINNKDYRRVNRIKYATDEEILTGCDTGILDWGYTETATLGTTAETWSEEAKKARAIAHILLEEAKHTEVNNLNEDAAERKYTELLRDNDRKILYLEERVDKLKDQKLLLRDEYEEFTTTKKVTPLIKGLLYGLSREEATKYSKLINKKDADLTDNDQEKIISYQVKMRGLTDSEAKENSVAAASKDKAKLEYWRLRMAGIPTELAERFQNLTQRYKQLDPKEKIEHSALINLRDSLTRVGYDTETDLAAREYSINKLFEYILLRTKEKRAIKKAEALLPRRGENLPHDDKALALLQTHIDQTYEANKLEQAEEKKLKAYLDELENEPLLRSFINNWESAFFAFTRSS